MTIPTQYAVVPPSVGECGPHERLLRGSAVEGSLQEPRAAGRRYVLEKSWYGYLDVSRVGSKMFMYVEGEAVHSLILGPALRKVGGHGDCCWCEWLETTWPIVYEDEALSCSGRGPSVADATISRSFPRPTPRSSPTFRPAPWPTCWRVFPGSRSQSERRVVWTMSRSRPIPPTSPVKAGTSTSIPSSHGNPHAIAGRKPRRTRVGEKVVLAIAERHRASSRPAEAARAHLSSGPRCHRLRGALASDLEFCDALFRDEAPQVLEAAGPCGADTADRHVQQLSTTPCTRRHRRP